MPTRDERQAADDARYLAEQAANNAEAVRRMRLEEERDRRDYRDWMDGKAERPTDGAARLFNANRDEKSAVSIKQALGEYAPTARKCSQCNADYVGSSRFCPPCTETAIREHGQSEQKRKAMVDGMTIHEARHTWANLPPDAGRTWDMKPSLGMMGLMEAITATKAWAVGSAPPWLVLTGSVGVGKSHLAEVAARTLAADGQRVRWQPVGELLDRLRQNQPDGDDNAYAHLAQVAATPWLVLDDLGRSKPSAWVLDRLYALVNSRAVRQARTLITTNETLGSMTASLGDAIADRVFDSHSGLVAVVTLTGPSYRTGR